MTVEDETQADVVTFLTETLPQPVQVIETHVSIVFLAGERALKLKKAVQFPFLDFRTLAARKDACEREIAINRRTAPGIYRGVVAVNRGEDGLELGGAGEAVEWLVDMARFDDATLFDRLAAEPRGLRRPMMETLADEIAAFHAVAGAVDYASGHARIRRIAENNGLSFAALDIGSFDADQVARVSDGILSMIDADRDTLDDRQRAGYVRACHGDLHLRNICLVDGVPTLFDAIEFSDDFSDIDILYDLAFLLMDLDFRGHRRLASFVLNRYLDVAEAGPEVFRVLPIFLAMRAQIRAHVGGAAAAAQPEADSRDRELERARAYLDLADSYLAPVAPMLIGIGGLSGSGKSRLSREIASKTGRAPGARVVRTDVVRKQLAGVHPNQALGPDGYTAEMTERTYQAAYDQVRAVIAAGQSAILDAVHAKAEQRQAVEALARDLGVPFVGMWVDAPEEVRVDRVMSRKNNVSDVSADIAREQSGYDLGLNTWHIVDSSGAKDATVVMGVELLRAAG